MVPQVHTEFPPPAPTHFHDHVTPNLGLILQNQHCFNKWDTITYVSAQNKEFCYGAEKGPYGHPSPTRSLQREFKPVSFFFFFFSAKYTESQKNVTSVYVLS